jgi:hypothetical protein
MKTFHCDHCQQLVFFENVHCVRCERPLAFMSDCADMVSLESAGAGVWRTSSARQAEAESRALRLCKNYTVENVCNWAIDARDANPLCRSCRLTRVIPDLSKPGHRAAWYRLEVAKRRLVYTLLGLGLSLRNMVEDPEHGLAFEFLADPEPKAAGERVPETEAPGVAGQDPAPVMTGHNGGVITVNVAEADDAEREKRRLALHEPYRTLLGHLRHEIAHYFWERLVKDSDRIHAFRERFGDERAGYADALARHYQQGPPADWQKRFVSAYASSHPWEDWAETWAHYLHIVDTLETAMTSGLSLKPPRSDEPTLVASPPMIGPRPVSFEAMMQAWFPVAYLVNNLNRGLGLADAYPFVLSTPAIEKLRFVHDTIAGEGRTGGQAATKK